MAVRLKNMLALGLETSGTAVMAMGSSLDQIGPLTKTVADAEILFNAIPQFKYLVICTVNVTVLHFVSTWLKTFTTMACWLQVSSEPSCSNFNRATHHPLV